jgi:hypothetical protein
MPRALQASAALPCFSISSSRILAARVRLAQLPDVCDAYWGPSDNSVKPPFVYTIRYINYG